VALQMCLYHSPQTLQPHLSRQFRNKSQTAWLLAEKPPWGPHLETMCYAENCQGVFVSVFVFCCPLGPVPWFLWWHLCQSRVMHCLTLPPCRTCRYQQSPGKQLHASAGGPAAGQRHYGECLLPRVRRDRAHPHRLANNTSVAV